MTLKHSLPPKHPEQGKALATPFAIEISDDDATLVVTAAGSDKLFTVDAASGDVLGRISVGAVPRGIALENSGKKKVSAAAFRLKGGGWYETDFKKGGKKNVHDSGNKSTPPCATGSCSATNSD